jgi:hypothetical protein
LYQPFIQIATQSPLCCAALSLLLLLLLLLLLICL